MKPNLLASEITVSPSILSADFSRLGDEIALINLSKAKLLHIDVMDGAFVPNISFGSCVMKSIRNKTDLIFDVHLMINHPIDFIEDFAKSGADIITFHTECLDDNAAIIAKIKSFGIGVGIAIKPKTKLNEILPLLKDVDMCLVMTVEPGFSGQSFMHEQMEKVRNLKEYIRKENLLISIEVDGGINSKTADIAKAAGANILVAGSYIFGDYNYSNAVESLL